MITYIIFNVSEIDKIDFEQVKETSKETLRISIDKTKTFIKWEEDKTPSFFNTLTTTEGPYTYEKILEILDTDIWTDYNIIKY